MRKIATLLFVIFSFAACEKDDSASPDSNPRDVFIAAWDCNENSQQSGISTFEMHINKSSTDSSRIFLENLYNYGFTFAPYADVNAAGTGFTIPTQTIQGNMVHRSGTLLGTNTINMNYIIDNGTDIDSVTAELTRK